MERSKVKEELRAIRKLHHRLNMYKAIIDRHNAMIEYSPQNASSIEETIKILDIDNKVNLITELENKYLPLIHQLPNEVDQDIVIDAFINGTPYWKIGNKIGYSTRTVEEHIKKSIDFISKRV